MGLFKELMNAVENRLYGTGATATAKENNRVQMILIQTGKAYQALYVGSILNEVAAVSWMRKREQRKWKECSSTQQQNKKGTHKNEQRKN